MELLLKFYAILFAIHMALLIAVNLSLFYFSRRKTDIAREGENQFSVAMVIPCYNEETIIKRKLANSVSLSPPGKSFSIYVVDDGSSDDTFQVASKFRQDNRVENMYVWRNPENSGKTKTLKWFFSKIGEDIVVITDADVTLEKDALLRLTSDFNDPKIGAVTGKIVIANEEKGFTTKTEGLYRKIFDVWMRGESNLDSCTVFNGPLMAFRREMLEKIKIDDEMHTDDIGLLFKTRRLGYRAVYEPESVFYESADSSMSQQIKRKIRRASALNHVLVKNLGVLGRCGSFGRIVYPFSMYIHVVGPVFSLILLLLSPVIFFTYPLFLLCGLFLLVRTVRMAFVGFIVSQIVLILGLITPERARWETIHYVTDAPKVAFARS